MKPAETYTNKFPLEELLPDLDEKEVRQIVSSCDYNIEASQIAKSMGMPEVNEEDAIVFYKMGYERAQKELNNKLIPNQ